jgi:polyisoprenyl-phosphate glycosyltransferase
MTAADPRQPPGRIAVVLPVYLNRPQLPELHRRLTTVLLALTDRYELVFVDDGGADGSLEWLRDCRAQDPHVRLVEMPGNSGQHQAVLAGLTGADGDLVAVMDADLQDPPEALPDLIGALDAEIDVVFARRAARHQSRGRHLTGRLFKRFLRALAGSRIPAGTGMFFVASRRAVDAALAMSAGARYVPLLFDRAGVRMTAVEVVKEMRPDSPSAYSTARRLRLAAGALRQALEWRRAKRHTRERPASGLRPDEGGQRQPLAREQHRTDRP